MLKALHLKDLDDRVADAEASGVTKERERVREHLEELKAPVVASRWRAGEELLSDLLEWLDAEEQAE